MVYVYLKNLRKSWITGFVPPLIVIGFVGMIAFGFPSMIEVIIGRLSTMNQPIMKAIIGDLGLEGLGLTWEATLFMYAGGTLNLVVLFVAIFIPARILSTEVDKKTLDIMLSYPIPRWRYLLEKFGVFLTYSLLLPISIVGMLIGSTMIMNTIFPNGYSFENPATQLIETHLYEIDTNLVVNYALGVFLLLFALGSISLLVSTIFLESNRSLSVAGLIIAGQYFLDSMAGLLDPNGNLFSADPKIGIQNFSLFNYFSIGTIIDNASMLPLLDVLIVVGVGIVALVSGLFIFQKREFAI
ncbi:MAG: ABC transporter permease subunit [Candidatus Hodarchaeales archaeon]|jgi:ABC-type transport system involved in multi-copper enzyme maturation permease subunit